EALRQRGLSDAEIDRRGYRSLPVRGRACLARDLRERFGDTLLSVPGFIIKQGKEGRAYLTIAGAAGLLIPVPDLAPPIAPSLCPRGGTARATVRANTRTCRVPNAVAPAPARRLMCRSEQQAPAPPAASPKER